MLGWGGGGAPHGVGGDLAAGCGEDAPPHLAPTGNPLQTHTLVSSLCIWAKELFGVNWETE